MHSLGLKAVAAAVALAIASAGSAEAQGLEAGTSTIDGGGASFVSAGSFILGGTIGQPDAGSLTAGQFNLLGGFWTGGAGGVVSVEGDSLPFVSAAPPSVLRVYPAAPNPAFRGTQLRLDVPATSDASVEIYDLNGALVRDLVDRALPAGHNTVIWDGRDDAGKRVSAGLYFVRIRVGAHSSTQKVVVVR
jgi:hypothetical protein